ncbi:hypothetical protein KP509_15G007200 [Ceratopteris richardii]|uniref:Plastocyanin-like domain-containing protein n=1 Tax=Ceratopteris richardii TaxID=49495 RepID=A0A8T2T0T7_CERRI|nr:hypothetical protein KP509_15G007200 [Ceratopteris richardii]
MSGKYCSGTMPVLQYILVNLWLLALMVTSFMLHVLCKQMTIETSQFSPTANTNSIDIKTSLQITEGLQRFVDKLPLMPTLKGYATSSYGKYLPANLTIGMYMKPWKFHRDLPPSPVFAFGVSPEDATVPGPSIVAMSGVETYILWENHLPDKHIFVIDKTIDVAKPSRGVPTVVHLHGAVTEPNSDGSALAWYTRDFHEKGEKWSKAVYIYHNVMTTGSMWYHDHALGYTRLNLLAGLIGAYRIINPEVESRFGLPHYKFDQELVIMDRSFNNNGHIYINSTGDNPNLHPEWKPEYFGRVIIVNGKAWPYMKVQRRKYRFRIINASNARFFRLALNDGTGFTQIVSDSFYLASPIYLTSALLAPSETMDVVIDFSKIRNQSVILSNDAPYPFPNGDMPGVADSNVMKFVVARRNVYDSACIPTQFEPVRKLSEEEAVTTRNIVMYEYDSWTGQPTKLLLNFANFNDPVTEFPKQGTTELWHIVNITPDNHPFHIHLAAFQVLRQQKLKNVGELSKCAVKHKGIEACNITSYSDGDPVGPPSNEAGWKNVFKMQPSYVTSILVLFSTIHSKPFPFDPTGDPGYVYHCHILGHEDNSMIRPFVLVS